MQLTTPNDHLPRLISRFAHTAMSSRQVAKRLWSLLPVRYRELKREHARDGGAGGRSERRALTDPRYEGYVDELTKMTHAAVRARVEYETHAMLFQARQSLRGLRRW